MIKKYMNRLYKEIEQIRRKIDGGHLKCFGYREYLNANSYTVILKDGSYFYIELGTKYIPRFKKKDVVFIGKQTSYNSLSQGWGKWKDYIDSNRGITRYDWINAHRQICDYEETMFKKYNVNVYNNIDTGSWD